MTRSRGMNVERAGGMATSAPPTPVPGLNVGQAVRQGALLATREVLAIIHEACRHPGVFPQSPDDLWITDTGEVLVAQSDRSAGPLDPRTGVAALLDALLPREPDPPLERTVSESLRGLSSRLRGASTDAKHRRDLMAILMWHIGAEPRDVIERLASRLRYPQHHAETEAASAAASDELDLFPGAAETAPPAPLISAAEHRSSGLKRTLAVLGAGVLMISVGYASYVLFRGADALDVEPQGSSPAPIAPPSPATTAEVPPATHAAVQPIQIEMPGGAFSPAFGPTRAELFFHAGRATAGRLLVARFDDSGRVASIDPVIEEEGARNYHPRLSPDGRWLAFDSDRDGERGVYIMQRGSDTPQRVSGRGYAAVPSWSPDMKWLAFIRGEASRPRVWNLWLRDVHSGALTRHTSFPSGQVWGASWFPDGRSLAYSHEDRLIISHLDGRDDIVLASPRPGHLVRTPAVSPDGTRVVFQVFRDGVWLLDVDTRQMRQLFDDATAEEFAWSPDGRQIAYHSRRDGAWKIWSADMASIAMAP